VRIGEEPYKVPPSDRVLNDFFPPMDTGQTTVNVWAVRY